MGNLAFRFLGSFLEVPCRGFCKTTMRTDQRVQVCDSVARIAKTLVFAMRPDRVLAQKQKRTWS